MGRRASILVVSASMLLLLAACGSEADEQAQVISVTPTAVATTAPLSVPTLTPVPPPTVTPLPVATATPLPAPTVAPTVVPPPTVEPTSAPASDAAEVATDEAAATETVEVIETPTPVPTSIPEEPESEEGASDVNADDAATPVPETPTASQVVTGEPPLECFDREIQVYRGFVDGVDDLSFEAGRVYCSGAGTNRVSAGSSYRHSTGLVVQRNADFILDDSAGTYIPYSGAVHFCLNGQPSSAPVRADTVPSLLVVIDNEARRQVAQGATGPASFTGSGSQC